MQVFFDDFTELLSIVCIDFDRLVIVGDFNIHVDNPQDRGAKELFCVLTQHVTEPTHNKGHTLDLIISKGLNISKLVVTDVPLSDHSCVFFESSIPVQTIAKKEVTTRRHLSENAQEMFVQNFSSSIAHANVSVNELVDHFNSKITNVMDTIPLLPLK